MSGENYGMHCKEQFDSTVRNIHKITTVKEIIQWSNLPKMNRFNKFSSVYKQNTVAVYNIQLMNRLIISYTVSFV
jgi:hypothetical protein